MSNLSLSQEYMMCALNDKGKISTFSLERVIAVAASAVVELMMDDIIESDGKSCPLKKPCRKTCVISALFMILSRKKSVLDSEQS